MMDYPRTEAQEELVARARRLAAEFAPRAAAHDRAGSFPYENYAALRREGFPALSVPRAYGGWGAGLLDCVIVMEELARGDASTALNFTMHVQTIGDAAESRKWPEPIFTRLCREAVTDGALVNAVASEPELGSPSRGGRPKTTAMPLRADGGAIVAWRIDGRKSWASMSPVLAYMIIPAALEDGSGDTARFLVPASDGVEIVETWDALGMRATGSHDVYLRGVNVPDDALIARGAEGPSGKGSAVNAWFMLTVSAVYLGIGQAALDAAAAYARERVPTALGKPIAEVETIQRQIGQGAYLVAQARLALHHAASLWESMPDHRQALVHQVNVAKVTATNNAIGAVDHALRVAGGAGVSRALPLERHYRDVRAGLNHPINDDAAYLALGRAALAAHKAEARAST
jgi:alkylation response protein AidB-like acyl-CoA dehydrogenase